MAEEVDSRPGSTTAVYMPTLSTASVVSTAALEAAEIPPTLTTKDDPDNDNERVSASNSSNYYDSNDGGRRSCSPLFRCERCDKFETHSHPLLLIHTVQCAAAVAAAAGLVVKQHQLQQLQQQQQQADADDGDIENSSMISDGGGGSGGGGCGGDRQQSSRKLFECDVCNMKFSNGANMRRHKMRHTGVKPYECRVCQKRFFRKDHLAEHFTTHTKTLPYHCPICNRGFQRQIAMRAHFQNEHVGHHDLVKTCPLCSYRAGTMKSLRVHFFNRHGIDLDNPGPGAPSSLLLALDPQNAANYLPSTLNTTTSPGGTLVQPHYSDSGDSLRSAENGTPPMHFLTPHVEISMAENADSFNSELETSKINSNSLSLEIKPSNRTNGGSPTSPQSGDSNNSNAATSSSSHTLVSLVQNSRITVAAAAADGHITPSISLIPIKQEPSSEDFMEKNNNRIPNSSDQLSTCTTVVSNSTEASTPTSSLTSMIKVSPLKSLLREDLKRRICARANSRATRHGISPPSSQNPSQALSVTQSFTSHSKASGSSDIQTCTSATTTNGIITSTGQESELSPLGARSSKHLQCLFCGIEFPDQTLYFLHKGCHSESNPWKCNICGEQCNNVYEFNSHLLSKSHQ